MHVTAIIAAAGSGSRVGSAKPKQMLDIGGGTMLQHSVRAFHEHPRVTDIVLVVPAGITTLAFLLKDPDGPPLRVVKGGERRQDSVRAGLALLGDDFDGVVLVHDAARPLVETALIESVARAARESGAAIPVLELTDTIKKMRDGRVRETVDRAELAAAQTPQGFRFALLARAYEAAFRDRVLLTDEAMAVERVGEAVVAVPGSARNRKITTPEDLAWAEVELARAAARP